MHKADKHACPFCSERTETLELWHLNRNIYTEFADAHDDVHPMIQLSQLPKPPGG